MLLVSFILSAISAIKTNGCNFQNAFHLDNSFSLAKLEDGLLAARTYSSQASILVEIMMFNSEFPCFKVEILNTQIFLCLYYPSSIWPHLAPFGFWFLTAAFKCFPISLSHPSVVLIIWTLTQSQGANPLHEFRSRFFLNLSEDQVRVEVRKMLKFATNHIGTRCKECLLIPPFYRDFERNCVPVT